MFQSIRPVCKFAQSGAEGLAAAGANCSINCDVGGAFLWHLLPTAGLATNTQNSKKLLLKNLPGLGLLAGHYGDELLFNPPVTPPSLLLPVPIPPRCHPSVFSNQRVDD